MKSKQKSRHLGEDRVLLKQLMEEVWQERGVVDGSALLKWGTTTHKGNLILRRRTKRECQSDPVN